MKGKIKRFWEIVTGTSKLPDVQYLEEDKPLSGIREVHFADIEMNLVNGKKEVVLALDKHFFRLPWKHVPEEFKYAYVAWLRFQKLSVPAEFKLYERNLFDMNNLVMKVDLDKAELLEE